MTDDRELCDRCGASGLFICERIETASSCPIGGIFCTQADIERVIAGHEESRHALATS